jgi:hypothetical protein
MKRIGAFFRFWSDFIIGEDWRVAASVALGLCAVWALSRMHIPAWWVLPLDVAVVLWRSSIRATRGPKRLAGAA